MLVIAGQNATFRSETRLETVFALSRTETSQTVHPKRLSLPWRCFARKHRKRAWWCGRRACVVVVRWWQCGGGGAAGDWNAYGTRARVCCRSVFSGRLVTSRRLGRLPGRFSSKWPTETGNANGKQKRVCVSSCYDVRTHHPTLRALTRPGVAC